MTAAICTQDENRNANYLHSNYLVALHILTSLLSHLKKKNYLEALWLASNIGYWFTQYNS